MIKLKIQSAVLILFALSSISGCSLTKIQQKGFTRSDSFDYKCQFSTVKTLIVLPVAINGTTKNFLFDTGADVTLVQRDVIKGKTTKIDGATDRSMKVGKEIIKSFKIGDVEFVDTYAMSGDLKGLKEQVPDFGGLIGQPVISKANWLIDYPNKRIEISNRHLIDSTFKPLKVKKANGASYITLSIDGTEYKALIDLGSSSAFTIPEGSKLAEQMLGKYEFQEKERAIFSIGGLKNTTEKTGSITTIYLDEVEFKNVATTIRPTSQLRIGNDFFKDDIIYNSSFKK